MTSMLTNFKLAENTRRLQVLLDDLVDQILVEGIGSDKA